jgi:hypothetical protein
MPSTNGIMVRDSHQREFCNTIGAKADMRWLSRDFSFGPDSDILRAVVRSSVCRYVAAY